MFSSLSPPLKRITGRQVQLSRSYGRYRPVEGVPVVYSEFSQKKPGCYCIVYIYSDAAILLVFLSRNSLHWPSFDEFGEERGCGEKWRDQAAMSDGLRYHHLASCLPWCGAPVGFDPTQSHTYYSTLCHICIPDIPETKLAVVV